MRLSLPTVIGIVAIASAGAFAAGRSSSPPPSPIASEQPASPSPASPPHAAMPMAPMAPMAPMGESDEALPPGHPPTNGAGAVPAPPLGAASATPSSLDWKIPARWQSAPNTSSMRIATYRVPHVPGDTEDGDLSITQAGGSVEANAARWIAQFDEPSQKSAKRSTRKVGPLEITIVEAKGSYTGMAAGARATSDRALLGAIVPTPGMPHFFKLTGPAKTVLAARAEFDALVASFAQPKP